MEEKKRWLLAHLSERVTEEKAERTVRLHDQMSGTPDQVAERLAIWEEAGMTYAIVYFADAAYDHSSMELFAKKVIPELG